MIRKILVCAIVLSFGSIGISYAESGDVPPVGWTGTLKSIQECDTEAHMREYAQLYDYDQVDDPTDAFMKMVDMEDAGYCEEVSETEEVTIVSVEDLGAIDGIASFYLLEVEQDGSTGWMLFQDLESETVATKPAIPTPPPPFEGSWTGGVTNMWICFTKDTWVELYEILDSKGLDALNAEIDSRGCKQLTSQNVTLSQPHYLGRFTFSNGPTDLWRCHIEDQHGDTAWALCDMPAQ